VLIVIAGGSGFLGKALTDRLVAAGHQVTILSRDPKSQDTESVRYRHWEPNGESGSWADAIDGANVVVNLAGAGMGDRRWTGRRKRLLYDSRINSTRSLAAAVRAVPRKPQLFIQQSAVGFYGAYDNGPVFDESSSPGNDFLSRMAVAWEAEAHPVSTLTRLVIFRTGVVLAAHGGALKRMVTPFKFFVGGPVASGRQTLSWIHLEDWTSLVVWTTENAMIEGPINACAPNPATSREFARAIGEALHRPSAIPVPGFVLKILFGELATIMLIKGQRVLPKRAIEQGYQFKFPDIAPAMRDLL
jgi:uncharacterized protein (TIGR01777 family)